MVRRRAAAAAHDVEPAIAHPGIELRRECLGRLRKSGRRKRIRQAGVRIGADEPVRAMGKFFDVRFHFRRAERAIQADDERLRMSDRGEKRFHGLSAQDSPGTIRDGARDQKRHPPSQLFEQFGNGGDRRFGVERVEDRLDGEQIHTAFQQRRGLFAICFVNLIERRGAETRIVHIRRKRGGDRQRPHRSGDETLTPGLSCHLVGGGSSEACSGEIYFAGQRRQFVVVDDALKKLRIFAAVFRLTSKEEVMQANGGAAESVRLDDVRSGLEIAAMDFIDDRRFGEEKNFKAAFEILPLPVRESFAPIFRFGELVLLDHGAHGAVEDDDALAQ